MQSLANAHFVLDDLSIPLFSRNSFISQTKLCLFWYVSNERGFVSEVVSITILKIRVLLTDCSTCLSLDSLRSSAFMKFMHTVNLGASCSVPQLGLEGTWVSFVRLHLSLRSLAFWVATIVKRKQEQTNIYSCLNESPPWRVLSENGDPIWLMEDLTLSLFESSLQIETLFSCLLSFDLVLLGPKTLLDSIVSLTLSWSRI